jgi:hypothetical protein
MTKTQTSANLDRSKTVGEFHMGRIKCVVTCIDKFGNEPHYGFMWQDDDGGFHSGWMPKAFVENFTGYFE